MLIVGDNEEEAGTISVRDRKEREQQDVSLETFREYLAGEVDEKRLEPDFLAE
jgi:threonyl-tRNA synthetase